MNYQTELKKYISDYLLSKNISNQNINLDKPKDNTFGDLTTNISLQVAKELSKNPQEIALEIKKYIEDKKLSYIAKISIAGAGFINFYLSNLDLEKSLDEILSEAGNYGKSKDSKGRIMVEYGQPNTHKALQIGHMKSGVIGLSIVKLLENSGYEVVKANYFGDIGKHVAKCLLGLIIEDEKDIESYKKIYVEFNEEKYKAIEEKLLKLKKEKGIHEVANYLNDVYAKGSELEKEKVKDAEEVLDILNKDVYNYYNKIEANNSSKWIQKLYKFTRELSIEHQTEVFKFLGVVFDRQYPESEIFNEGYELVVKNSDRNKDNKNPIFITDQGAVILPGEKYGLKRWVFITSQNTPTYSGKDLGLAYKKFKEYPDLSMSIYLTSVEQNDYFKAIIKSLELIDKKLIGKLKHMGFGWLLLGNKKTSSRSGKTIKVVELINEVTELAKEKITTSKEYTEAEKDKISKLVGIGALKFFILSYEFHRDVNYDPEKVLSLSGFSGPYVMYGYVRAISILNDANKKGIDIKNISTSNKEKYEMNDDEKVLMSQLLEYPSIASKSADEFSPHKIAHYLFDVTDTFNKFYSENKVLGENIIETNFRLKLTKATSIVLKNGLGLLGIETTDKM